MDDEQGWLNTNATHVAWILSLVSVIVAWSFAKEQATLEEFFVVLAIWAGSVTAAGAALRLAAHRDKPWPPKDYAPPQPNPAAGAVAAEEDWRRKRDEARDAARASRLDGAGKTLALVAGVGTVVLAILRMLGWA